MNGVVAASVHNVVTPDDVPRIGPEEDVSLEVMRDLHADAIRLHRSELSFILPSAVLALAVSAAIAVAPRQLWVLALYVAPVMLRVCQWGVEWWRLRATDPVAHFQRERRVEAEKVAGVKDIEARTGGRRPAATQTLIAGLGTIAAIQFLFVSLEAAVNAAGLVKAAAWAGEWWRLLTASYLHGNLPHVIGNVGALGILGRVIETYDRRLRVVLVYLAGVLGGSLFSLLLTPGTGVGSSGGVLGLAGYLLVLTSRCPADGLRWFRTNLLAMLAGVAVLGAVGFSFIDNSAHLGGALAGLFVGIVAAPRDVIDHKQSDAQEVDVIGWTAASILLAGGLFTVWRLLA